MELLQHSVVPFWLKGLKDVFISKVSMSNILAANYRFGKAGIACSVKWLIVG
jgi:hypothetical protein